MSEVCAEGNSHGHVEKKYDLSLNSNINTIIDSINNGDLSLPNP